MQKNHRVSTRVVAIVGALIIATAAEADGIVVDKIYDPYVQPLETELEFRTLLQDDDGEPAATPQL